MRQNDSGSAAGTMTGTGLPSPRPPGGLLTGGAADQLAELVARAARAPTGVIYFVQDGERLCLAGAQGLPGREKAADRPIKGSLAELVLTGGPPLAVGDIATEPLIPAGSPLRAVP